MRKFKPAPKQASANRIRERYLHQLGLQRGAVASSSSSASQQQWDDHNTNHVVVISGLPSLPEDRATNDNVLESHDFSHADGSYITYDEGSCSNAVGGAIAIHGGPPQHLYQPSYPPQSGDSSHCSRSTLSTSPHNNNHHYLGNGNMADESMTSMALACPHMLLKSNQVHNGTAAAAATTSNSTSTLPFSLSWGGTSQLSRSAAVLLDEAGGGLPASSSLAGPRSRSNTENSVSSAATATTAESSFTATMVSRDWGSSATAGGAAVNTTNVVAIPQPTPSGTASVSSMGDSVTSAPVSGVFFQGIRGGNSNNHHSSSSYASTGPAHCVATSSLASALNRFNIDSDCEASIASNSIIDDPTMMMMDHDSCHNNNNPIFDDSASCASHISGGSSSIASCTNPTTATTTTTKKPRPIAKKKKNKKIGKNQRLLDRASAHERMMIQHQMRNNDQRSSCVQQKLRVGMVHSSQRTGCSSSLGGLPMPHQLGGGGTTTSSSPTRSCSSSVTSHASSLPLMHVDHQATPMSTPVAAMSIISTSNNSADLLLLSPPVLPKQPPSFGGSDLGRTPTASNCSQQHSNKTTVTLPTGVYLHGGANCGPLNYHPQLFSKVHMPPPRPAAAPAPNNVMASSPPPSSSLPRWSITTDRRDESKFNSPRHASEMESAKLANVVVPSMQHGSHKDIPPFPSPPVVKRAESIEDDVMEVAVTLSMLGGGGGRTTASNGGGGMIPRVR
mmetsp:Transcript_3698/g.5632  ORF Transcript_3698/g.5632 Transcript_3698/m.5632 type:complete len:730 (+) Transcript_3698:203-2392(+)|eukprot:CAMPEP_0201729034 /NCGR_PEP_ID=MMETSP0593-20130828/17828_1 /ASSEMBLY_ACC=CAM_ASM_000672 /TAXON_ID=267983 /ORGANISM="Skeletonema japonicum, Strain CCMP2506" /LENGTH=729 /DNA_ID=CAMNT_0048221303 /DNA_START=197 /DNA_END=2386 /DNA_ORIENTATION=-